MTYHPRHIQAPGLPFPNMRAIGDPGPMPRTCRWPLWDDQERATHVYCGAPNVAGRVYCATHCQRAYGRVTEPRTPGLATSGSGLATRSSPSAQAGAAPPVPAVPAAPKPRQSLTRKRVQSGAAPFVRVNPPIDLRLCVNDREREIVTAWNGGKSQRAIAAMLGVSHNVIAGKCSRIRKRELGE